jgi:hypothetical protein
MLSDIPADAISSNIFPFLSLIDHINFASCTMSLHRYGGLTSPIHAPWRKHVYLDTVHIRILKTLHGRFIPTELTIGCGQSPLELCNLEPDTFFYICHLPLVKLVMNRCTYVSDAGLFHLQFLSQLRYLDLNNSKIDDTSLCYLQDLLHLHHLNLDGTGITDNGLGYLRLLPLTHLSLNNCRVYGHGLRHITTKLQYLSMRRCMVSDDTMHVMESFSNLTVLNLNMNPISILSNLRYLPLQSLYLSETNMMEHELRILRMLFHLTCLDISWCEQVTNNTLYSIRDLPLKQLNLSSCNNITDNGLVMLSRLPLVELNLSICNLITVDGVNKYIDSAVKTDTMWCDVGVN